MSGANGDQMNIHVFHTNVYRFGAPECVAMCNRSLNTPAAVTLAPAPCRACRDGMLHGILRKLCSEQSYVLGKNTPAREQSADSASSDWLQTRRHCRCPTFVQMDARRETVVCQPSTWHCRPRRCRPRPGRRSRRNEAPSRPLRPHALSSSSRRQTRVALIETLRPDRVGRKRTRHAFGKCECDKTRGISTAAGDEPIQCGEPRVRATRCRHVPSRCETSRTGAPK